MAIADLLRSAQGGQTLRQLAQAYDLTPDQAAAVADAVMPRLSEQLERNTLSRGGLADLVGALGHGHHEAYLDDATVAGRVAREPAARDDGNAILEHILGTKDKSRAIADRAAVSTGVPAAVIKSMLPVLAGMFMGGLSKQVKASFGDILGRVPAGQGGVFLPKRPLPRGAPAPTTRPEPHPDRHGGGTGDWGQDDGNVRSKPDGGLELPGNLPDYSDPGSRQQDPRRNSSGSPLPLPGNRVPGMPGNGENPYGDLAEILRRGLGLPGGSGGPVVIQLPGGGSFPFPFPGNDGQSGQSRGRPAPQPRDSDTSSFPWPNGGGGQSGETRGNPLPMPPQGGGEGSFPWPQSGGGGSPLPMPGGPGGGRMELPGGQVGGGMLWNIIRSILGGALGFQSKGVISWIVRMVVMKYGWQILRTILGGMAGRR